MIMSCFKNFFRNKVLMSVIKIYVLKKSLPDKYISLQRSIGILIFRMFMTELIKNFYGHDR